MTVLVYALFDRGGVRHKACWEGMYCTVCTIAPLRVPTHLCVAGCILRTGEGTQRLQGALQQAQLIASAAALLEACKGVGWQCPLSGGVHGRRCACMAAGHTSTGSAVQQPVPASRG